MTLSKDLSAPSIKVFEFFMRIFGESVEQLKKTKHSKQFMLKIN